MARKMFDYAATRNGVTGNGLASRRFAEAIMGHGTDGASIMDADFYRGSADIRDLIESLQGTYSDEELAQMTPNDLVFAARASREQRIPR